MPWNQGTYTPPAAAENAFAGKVIASADWNTIFTDIQLAFNQLAGANPTISGIDFNSIADTTFTIALPTGYTRFLVDNIVISGPSAPLSTATVALFTAAGGAGTQIVTSTGVTVASTVSNTFNNAQFLAVTASLAINASTSATSLFFRVMKVQGSAATASVTLHVKALP